MLITITICTADECFDERAEFEVARILRTLADRFNRDGMLAPGELLPIISIDGNRVGECEATS